MKPAAGVQEFLGNPVGQYLAGRSFVIWAQSPSSLGSAYFGRVHPDDHAVLSELFDLHLHAHLRPPYDALCDGGSLDVLDAKAFALLLRYMLPRWPAIAARVRRLAIVRPSGLAGAALSGIFHDNLRGRARTKLFDGRGEALAWLGLSPAARDQVEVLMRALAGRAPILRELQRYLGGHLEAGTLDAAARSIGMSARSLQRSLREHGTSFRAERDRARVLAAETLLTEG